MLKFHKLGKRSLDQQKISKVKHYFEGSRHPNSMNPFEYGKSFHNKSFPKRMGTLPHPAPKYLGGHNVLPPGL